MPHTTHNSLPIENAKQDLLGRENIVRAITLKIRERAKRNIHCEVIGVYGKWGEGKSSVFKLVQEQLIQKSEENTKEEEALKIKIIEFNPWLFKDQESLLLDFFKVLQKGMTSDKLKSKIKQYGPLVAVGAKELLGLFVPKIGSIDNSFIEKLFGVIPDGDIDLQSLKEEINEQIILSKEHNVIFIDDVDRLDKDELHTLFKLIKQNADFINTTYVIAMDVDMVAKSIANRFEDGGENAGRNFLEKIVQYPVYLPKVQRSKMLDMFEELVVSSFEDLYVDGVSINMQPEDKLKNNLINYIFPLFNTVREMIIYRNAISFVLPSVYREVNLTDFAILEVLKQFHPKAYDLIKQSKSLLTGEVFATIAFTIDDRNIEHKKRRELDKFKTQLLEDIDPNKFHQINNLLSYLLTIVNEKNFFAVDEKRLCSSRHFDNYFLYDIRENLAWNQDIEELFYIIPTDSDDSILSRMETIALTSGIEELIYALRQALNNFGAKHLKIGYIDRACYALSRLEINRKRKYFIESNFPNVEIHITSIINNYCGLIKADNKDIKYNSVLDIIKRILESEEIYPFHVFLITSFAYENYMIEEHRETFDNIVYDFTIRFINKYGLDSIFNLSMMPIYTLFSSWKSANEKEYREKIDKHMFADSFNIVSFIERTTEMPQTKTSFSADASFKQFRSIFDTQNLYNTLIKEDLSSLSPATKEVIEYFMSKSKEEQTKDHNDRKSQIHTY